MAFMKPSLISALLALLMANVGCSHLIKEPIDEANSNLIMGQNYVLAACIMDRYEGKEIAYEAEIWAQGIVEMSNIQFTAYPDLANIVSNYAVEPQLSRHGNPMLMKNCISLYNDKDVVQQVYNIINRKD
ncbi:MAG: hypothetical protein MI864_00565 [Pseudomonadales bacterium]|uniref:Type VI secretion system-associated immunity protein n=1 Tax=Oleiphilus messinensis TaxID=141451 RepID=A0A1Y0ICY9_9GAMM|nr:hypothetical protein [Oleiphilus messinensis]ARU58387.1 type VI secretion system-associated immunity protein [Oleiphilus messinensis]MCG8609002.1 hypothetical protein [Pseudomonadales bacterium]